MLTPATGWSPTGRRRQRRARACAPRAHGGRFACAPYDSLNLGDHVGDDAGRRWRPTVRCCARRIGARPVFLQQVHGTRLLALRCRTRPTAARPTPASPRERGIACTIMVADCLPVLFTDGAGRRGGRRACRLARPGRPACWRQAVERLRARAPMPARQRSMAWLGPCIGPEAFEVGDEVKAAFEAARAEAAADASSPARRRANGWPICRPGAPAPARGRH